MPLNGLHVPADDPIVDPFSRSSLKELANLLSHWIPKPENCTNMNCRCKRTPSKPTPSKPTTTITLPAEWLTAQKKKIASSSFPQHLRCRHGAPTLLLQSIVHWPGRGRQRRQRQRSAEQHYNPPPPQPLCAAHRRLDPELLGLLYGLLRAEVSVRVDRIRAYLRVVRRREESGEGEYEYDHVGPEGRELLQWFVDRMSCVAGLYMTGREVDRLFGNRAGRWEGSSVLHKVKGGCPASVLAVVGGDDAVLVVLRASLKARAKGKAPRLLGLVEGWMEGKGRRRRRNLEEESNMFVDVIGKARVVMEKRRREKKGGGGGERGRSKHRGGLPAGTKFVDGAPIPQVRLDNGESRRRRDYNAEDLSESFPLLSFDPVGGMKKEEAEVVESIWSSSVSSSDDEDEVGEDEDDEDEVDEDEDDEDGNWPHACTPVQAYSPLSGPDRRVSPSIYSVLPEKPSSIISTAPRASEYVRLQAETTKTFFGQSSKQSLPRQSGQNTNAGGQQKLSNESSATNWEDFYKADNNNRR